MRPAFPTALPDADDAIPTSQPLPFPPCGAAVLYSVCVASAVAFTAALAAAPALALETPIGKPQKQSGMEIAAVYLQPVPMEPAGMMKSVAESDIHLEADIHAQSDNKNGFADGAWIPYLGVTYEITKAAAHRRSPAS